MKGKNLEYYFLFQYHSQFKNKTLILTKDRRIQVTLTFIDDIFFFHWPRSLVAYRNIMETDVANNDVRSDGGGNVELDGG